MKEKNHSSLPACQAGRLTSNSSLIISLPPRNDTETEIFAQYDFPAGGLNFNGQDFNFPSGLHASAVAKWLEDSLLSVEISISGEAQASCDRCLEETSLEISGELRYLYYLRSAAGETEESEDEIEEFADYMPVDVEYFGRVLDIMPQVEESIFSLLPTKVLCKEDCKGLCPNCGKDLNEGECDCNKNEDIDPRLDALRDFKL